MGIKYILKGDQFEIISAKYGPDCPSIFIRLKYESSWTGHKDLVLNF
jgi:hypothetical protein